jgi:YHS domain-containing protein
METAMNLTKAHGEKPSKIVSSKKSYCQVCPTWEIKLPDRCSNTIEKKGKKMYFCTKRCKERFIKAPEKFL